MKRFAVALPALAVLCLASPSDQPLQISQLAMTPGPSEVKLSFLVTNISGKAVAGCRLLIGTGHGVPAYGYTRQDLAGVGSMAPGKTWPVEVSIMTPDAEKLTAATARVSVDYVVFEDKSSWGPDTEKMGLAIRAEINGARAERARLQRLLREGGWQKVVVDLQRP